MKYVLEITLPGYQGVEDELEEALVVKAARGEFEELIREWVLDFLTTDVPYTAVKVKVRSADDG